MKFISRMQTSRRRRSQHRSSPKPHSQVTHTSACPSDKYALDVARPTNLRADSPLEEAHGMHPQGSRAGASPTDPHDPRGGRGRPWVFINVTNPYDMEQHMSAIRKAAMNDYLNRESQNPDATDPRVQATKCTPRSTSLATTTSLGLSSPESPAHSLLPSSPTSCTTNRVDRDQKRIMTKPKPLPKYPERPKHSHSPDPHEETNQSPTFPASITANSDTFPVLPKFRFKFDATSGYQLFSTPDMHKQWIPVLRSTEHTFLSALCMTIAFEVVMREASHPDWSDKQLVRKWATNEVRFKAMDDVFGMLLEALNDPQTQTQESTIATVLQLLNNEIINGNDNVVEIHRRGLMTLVHTRGGLDELQKDCPLAGAIAMAMHLISTITEMPLDAESRNYLARGYPAHRSPDIPNADSFLFDYEIDILHARPRGSLDDNILQLLSSLQYLTETETQHNNPCIHFNPRCTSSAKTLIFRAAPSSNLPSELTHDTPKTHRYEALRLTACIYATALIQQIPFSLAAAMLTPPDSTPIYVRIAEELNRTALDDAWNELEGVLFFIVLIASACTNPRTVIPTSHPLAESCRKSFGALAVRSSIRLSFRRHTLAVHTLRNIVQVQTRIRESHPLPDPDPLTIPVDDLSFSPPTELDDLSSPYHLAPLQHPTSLHPTSHSVPRQFPRMPPTAADIPASSFASSPILNDQAILQMATNMYRGALVPPLRSYGPMEPPGFVSGNR